MGHLGQRNPASSVERSDVCLELPWRGRKDGESGEAFKITHSGYNSCKLLQDLSQRPKMVPETVLFRETISGCWGAEGSDEDTTVNRSTVKGKELGKLKTELHQMIYAQLS